MADLTVREIAIGPEGLFGLDAQGQVWRFVAPGGGRDTGWRPLSMARLAEPTEATAQPTTTTQATTTGWWADGPTVQRLGSLTTVVRTPDVR